MGEFLRAEIAAGHRYLPAGPNVLRAFTFPFDQVRVLIVGQDPYPTPGHAVGLSFSVAADVRPLPRSLENIFSEYAKDLGYPPPATGDLTPWAERGVMLLNRVLTVRPGNPASHRGKGWEAVTECAIRALVAREQPLVAVLWGRDASTLKPMLDRQRLHGDRIAASLAAVGVAWFLRLAAVQPCQRAAGEDGRRPDRLAPALRSQSSWRRYVRLSRTMVSGPVALMVRSRQPRRAAWVSAFVHRKLQCASVGL